MTVLHGNHWNHVSLPDGMECPMEFALAVPNLDEWTYCSVSVEFLHLSLPLYGSSETDILHQTEHCAAAWTKDCVPDLDEWKYGSILWTLQGLTICGSRDVWNWHSTWIWAKKKKKRTGKLNKGEFTMCQTWKNINTRYFWNSFEISRRSHHLW